MTKYGYTRVSSKSQENNSSLEGQKQQLIENGILEKNILVEVGSAANEIKNRPIFQTLINQKLQEGDVLMVTKIDRCSRNTLEFLKLQEKLFKKSVRFISLDLPYSNHMAVNQLIATKLAAIVTFEKATRHTSKYRGRKTVITKKLID
jgi:DNA invertase Pin-like site-specific DNA recombinase